MDQKTPFKDTKMGVWLKANVPQIADTALTVVGNIYPPISGITNMIKGAIPDSKHESDPAFIEAAREYQLMVDQEHGKEMASARDREVQISTSDKAPLINKVALPVLAVFITFGFFGILAYMLLYNVPVPNKDVLNIMLGSLGTAWLSVVMYYFGSSSGSADKSRQIEVLTNKL
jgi:hypothetical protein